MGRGEEEMDGGGEWWRRWRRGASGRVGREGWRDGGMRGCRRDTVARSSSWRGLYQSDSGPGTGPCWASERERDGGEREGDEKERETDTRADQTQGRSLFL